MGVFQPGEAAAEDEVVGVVAADGRAGGLEVGSRVVAQEGELCGKGWGLCPRTPGFGQKAVQRLPGRMLRRQGGDGLVESGGGLPPARAPRQFVVEEPAEEPGVVADGGAELLRAGFAERGPVGMEHVGEGRAGGVAVGEDRAVGVALGEVLSEAERRDVRKAPAAAQLHVAGRTEVVEAPRAEPSEGFLRPGRLGRIVGLAEAAVGRMAERVAEGTARMDPAAAEHEARRAVRRDDAGAPVDVGDAEEAGGRHVGGIRGEGGMDRSERKRDDGGDSHVKRLLSGSCGRKAPSARRAETRRPGSSERGLAPAAQDRAAAVPAAWPMAMHGGMTRIAAAAQALALTHRPATSRPSAPRGTRQR